MKPYIIAAFLCEKVLQETDKVLSAIRIIDIFTVPPRPKELSPEIQPTIQMTMLAMFRSEEPSSHSLTFDVVSPSGKVNHVGNPVAINIVGQEHGANVVIQFPVNIGEAGSYWIDLLLDGDRVTRVPFAIQLSSQPSTLPIQQQKTIETP
jgi:hypothetical protein